MSEDNFHECPNAGEDSSIDFPLICTNGSDTTLFECVEHTEGAPLVLRYIQGIWFLLVFILGTFGNLSTIIAIPLAIKINITGFQQAHRITNFFIWHLSVVELWHCITYTFGTSYAMLVQSWPFGTLWCIVCAGTSGMTFYLQLISLNLIGISRCVLIKTKRVLWYKYAYLFAALVIILWIPCVILFFPSFTGITFGWHCYAGACDFYIPYDKAHSYSFNHYI